MATSSLIEDDMLRPYQHMKTQPWSVVLLLEIHAGQLYVFVCVGKRIKIFHQAKLLTSFTKKFDP